MNLRLWAALAFAIGYAFAADAVLGPTGANNATTPTAQEGDTTIHYVTVGKITPHEFQPNSIVAKKGDIVSFQFYPLNHSVIEAAYGYPCIPIQAVDDDHSQFYSGFFPVNSASNNPPTWNLTVNSTEPTFYYCGAPGSCTDWGMVGVINANASTSLATQLRLAREADYMLLPGQQFPSEAVQASLSKLAHSATTTTRVVTTTAKSPTSSASPAPGGSSSGLSTGTVVGIAVGAAVAALVVAALFLLMRRTKKLKRKLELKTAASKVPPTWEQPGSPANTYPGGYFDPTRPNSQLPPYRPYHHLDRPDMSKPPRIESWAVDNAGNPIMTPLSQYGDGHQSPAFPPPSQNQWAANLSPESQFNSPAAELYAPRQEMSERRM